MKRKLFKSFSIFTTGLASLTLTASLGLADNGKQGIPSIDNQSIPDALQQYAVCFNAKPRPPAPYGDNSTYIEYANADLRHAVPFKVGAVVLPSFRGAMPVLYLYSGNTSYLAPLKREFFFPHNTSKRAKFQFQLSNPNNSRWMFGVVDMFRDDTALTPISPLSAHINPESEENRHTIIFQEDNGTDSLVVFRKNLLNTIEALSDLIEQSDLSDEDKKKRAFDAVLQLRSKACLSIDDPKLQELIANESLELADLAKVSLEDIDKINDPGQHWMGETLKSKHKHKREQPVQSRENQ